MRNLFSSRVLRFATIFLLLCAAAFGVWRAFFYQSGVDKGLVLLRAAYRGQRPLESRSTAGFDYAPFTVTRGGGGDEKFPAATDADDARTEARKSLVRAAQDRGDAAAHHALGLSHLAEREFDKALYEFNLAVRLEAAPGSARLHNDIGVAYLEKASLAIDEKADEFSENADRALEHFNRALELDKNLSEALFNKALVLQKIPIPNQAAEAWEKYLEKESASDWAAEAGRNVRELESKKAQDLDDDQLQEAFLQAFGDGREIEARQLIGQNKEIIKEKYLPQKLAMSLTAASGGERNKYRQALTYAGKLEREYVGDSFAADLADFYATVSESNLELLKKAHQLTREGYRLCLDGHRVREALEKFKPARELFLQAGDVWEARLSEFLIAYCLKNDNKIIESAPVIKEIIDFCRPKNYKWLLSTVLVWNAGAQRAIGDRAAAKNSYAESLALARDINDSFMIQSTLLELAKQSYFVGQNRAALRHLYGAFKSGDTAGASLRQRWRNYSDGAELLAKVKHYNLAKVVSLENIRLAKDLKDTVLLFYSELDVGIAHARAGDAEEAGKWLLLAKQNAASINNDDDRNEILAKTTLELGHLERKERNYPQAVKLYSEALGYVREKQTPYYRYEIQKSGLLAEMSVGDDPVKVEKQISETLEMAEEFREQISEEQERNSFFDNEQTIYDIAVAHDYKLGKYEQAYNHLEKSNSRSLLDWLKKGVAVKEDKKKIEITFREHAAPARLEEIRARMPERVQILQYTLLENKVLIWLVSKDAFSVEPVEIGYEELSEKVTTYAGKLSAPDGESQAAAKLLGRELYDLLIAPVAGRLDPKREICLIPHKILFHLPFAALGATDAAAAPDEKPFLEQFNFFYAPSANVFLLFTDNARRKSDSAAQETLLSVGNPRFDRREFPNLHNLPDAEDEALEIASFYPATPQKLIGPEATKAALQNQLKNAEVIHFAGHYIVRHGEPLSSGLLLTGTAGDNGDADADSGILTNAELIRQPLPRAKLVVLPACQTGVEQYYNGEGLVGLSRTFLAAGAPLVVASQWQVDSRATAKLMKRFHFYRRQEKLSTTIALRRAQLEMMKEPDGRYREPYFWAAFAVYGGHAEF